MPSGVGTITTTATNADSSSPSAEPLPPLVRLGQTPPLREYLSDIWSRREYLREVPAADLRQHHLDTVLGNVWQVLNPLLMLGVYYVVFGIGLRSDKGIDNFITFLAIGVFTFGLIQRSVTKGAKSIATNENLLRSIRFPRLILPLTGVLTETLSYITPMLVMLSIGIITGVAVTPYWLLMIPVMVMTVAFSFGGACTTARLGSVFRDIDNILPVAFRLAFYLSGILYSVDARIENPTFRALFTLNPFYCLITCARGAIFSDLPRGTIWLSAFLWSVGALIFGVLFFKRAEHTYGRA